MKKLMILIPAIGCLNTAIAQLKPADYFRLDVRKYTEGTESNLGVSPEIKTGTKGKLAEGIAKYPRRFRYILINKTDFQNKYEVYYPDTNRINRLFTAALSKDTVFMRAFTALSAPFVNQEKSRPTFSVKALLTVAARFFYCDGVNKDSTLQSHICINMNGVKALQAKIDIVLLEAFCFEAIFERFKKANGDRADFVVNFKTAIKQAEKQFKGSPNYLEQARDFCFAKMETDTDLEAALKSYYQSNKGNLPFMISSW